MKITTIYIFESYYIFYIYQREGQIVNQIKYFNLTTTNIYYFVKLSQDDLITLFLRGVTKQIQLQITLLRQVRLYKSHNKPICGINLEQLFL